MFGSLVVIAGTLRAQSFSDFVKAVEAAPEAMRMAMVDSFMAAVPSFPLVEHDTLASFLFRGTIAGGGVAGDHNGWNYNVSPLLRVSTTNLWYSTRSFPSDARLDYKFVFNSGNTWVLDPLNPYTCSGGYGPNSELRMPDYVPAPEILYRPAIPHGTLRDTTYFSTNLLNARTIRVYLPPGYSATGPAYPVIIVHDGLEYVSLAQMNNVLDYLTDRREIEPIVAVFVPPVNRTPEYAGNQITQFSDFIVKELLPYIEGRYNVRKDATSRATLGASNGGNISLWLAYNYPTTFGNVAAQSSNVVDSIQRGFLNSPKRDLKVYLDIGTFDIAVLIPMVRTLKGTLTSKGYDLFYKEYNEGHSWGNWRAHIDDALTMFFPAPPSGVAGKEEPVSDFSLFQNYPNPFNPVTVVSFQLLVASEVRLAVYDILGREVAVLVHEKKSPGRYEVEFDGTGRASGTYAYRATATANDGRVSSQTRMMTIIR